MKAFAADEPMEFSYDPEADTLYIKYAHAPVTRTLELLGGWPLVLVDLNSEGLIVGVEYVGAKQFGPDVFTHLLRDRYNQLAHESDWHELRPLSALEVDFAFMLHRPEVQEALSK